MNIRTCLPAFVLSLCALPAWAAPVSLTLPVTTYQQLFNTSSSLAGTGATGTTLAPGWAFAESGTGANASYGINIGDNSAGNTYSYGASGNSERALGMLRGDAFVSTIGASFSNDTGETIAALAIAYVGELWRLGAEGRVDRLDFQYSTDATSLADGTWTDVDALDFSTPPAPIAGVGTKVGNLVANRTAIASSIGGLSIPAGSTFWIRWADFDADGADDGMAVDDFSLTPILAVATPEPTGVPLPPAAFAGMAMLGGIVVRRRLSRRAHRA